MRILSILFLISVALQPLAAKVEISTDLQQITAEEAYDLLIASAYDPQKISNGGDTLLHTAAKKKDLLALQLGVFLGLDPSLPNKAGDTPLHIAASKGDLETVEYLLLLGVPFDWINGIEQTPYHKALATGDTRITEILIAKGFIPGDPVTDRLIAKGYCPQTKEALVFHDIAARGDVETLLELIEAKRYLSASAINNRGQTALMVAITKGQPLVVDILLQKEVYDATPRTNELMKTYGFPPEPATLELCSNNGLNALHYAIIRGDVYSTTKLLEAGANVNAPTQSEWKAEEPDYDNYNDGYQAPCVTPPGRSEYRSYNAGWVYPVVSPLSLALEVQFNNAPLLQLLESYGAQERYEPSAWDKELRTN